MNDDPRKIIPCFLCGNGTDVKLTKKKKPYFICETCGVQAFIRREKGISRLNELLKYTDNKTVEYAGTQGRVFDSIAQINRLVELKGKLKEIQDKKDFTESLTGDGSFSLAEKTLEKEIGEIEARLKSFLE